MVDPTSRDVVMAPLWAIANLLLIQAAWRLARRFFPDDDEDQLIIHSIVAGWACIAGLAMVLGAVGALSGAALMTAVALGAGLVLVRIRPAQWKESAGGTSRRSIAFVYDVPKYLLICMLLAHSILNGLGRFPEDWDTLMYHLPRVDQWIQCGSLFSSDSYNWSHPGNNELIGLWMVAPFSGDFLISLNNLPAVGLLGFASITLGRSLGLSRGLSYVTALATVSNAVVFRQLLDAKNDIAVAGLFLACLNYGLRAVVSVRIAESVWGGLCIGLLVGTKYNALGYAAVALATSALIVATGRGPRAAARMAVSWSVGLILCGGFWYIRNAIMVGNPLYPIGLTRESNVLAVIYPELHRSSLYGCRQAEVLPLAIDAVWRMAGPAHLIALLTAPAIGVWLASHGFLKRGKRTSEETWTRRVLALWMVGSGIILLITPFSAEDTPHSLNHLKDGYTPVRFGLSFFSVSLLAFSIVVQEISLSVGCQIAWFEGRFGRRASIEPSSKKIGPLTWMYRFISLIPLLVWSATVVVQCVNQIRHTIDDLGFHLLVSVALMEAGWILWLRRGLGIRLKLALDAALLLALGIGTAASCGPLSVNWHRNFARHYDAFFKTEAFDRLSAMRQRPERVCVLFYRAYPFHGSRRESRVLQPMWIPSLLWLLETMEANQVNVLVLATEYPLLRGWRNHDSIRNSPMNDNPEWQRVYGDASFLIFSRVQRQRNLSSKAEAVTPAGLVADPMIAARRRP